MNESKFSFADLFTVLATVGFGFFCFLSFNFLSLGETAISVVVAVIIACILGGLAFGAKLLKRTSKNFKTCIIWEWVLLFLFALLAFIFFIFPFSHYFVVSEQKGEIQQKVSDCISQSESMFDEYQIYAENRINIYEQELRVAISKGHDGSYIYPSKYSHFQFQSGGDDDKQLNNKINDLRNGLFEYPFSFQDEQRKYIAWITEAKKIMATWSPISVVGVVSNVKSNLSHWRENLNEMSKFRPKDKDGNAIENAKDFNNVYPPALYADDMERYFIGEEYSQSLTNATAFCWVVGLYVLMLLSWFITKRHYRYPGLKMIFGTGGNRDNEL